MSHAPPDVAALTEPTACALHAIERVGVGRADLVVVLGGGPIGLLAAMLAARARASGVVVCDVRDDVRQAAARVGVADVITGTPDDIARRIAIRFPQGADVVIEAAGQASTQHLGMQILARGGRLALVGLAGARTVPMNLDPLVMRDARVEATFAYPSAVFGRAASLLDAGEIDPRPLLTHRFPLSRVEAAFELLRTRSAPVVKVVLDPHA